MLSNKIFLLYQSYCPSTLGHLCKYKRTTKNTPLHTDTYNQYTYTRTTKCINYTHTGNTKNTQLYIHIEHILTQGRPSIQTIHIKHTHMRHQEYLTIYIYRTNIHTPGPPSILKLHIKQVYICKMYQISSSIHINTLPVY